jgi:hypothetical protein
MEEIYAMRKKGIIRACYPLRAIPIFSQETIKLVARYQATVEGSSQDGCQSRDPMRKISAIGL